MESNFFGFELEALDEIRESFAEGRLRLIVGAGASMAAGLPSWNKLNATLISRYFERLVGETSSQNTTFALQPEELDALSEVFVHQFGRDSVVDVLRREMDSREDFEALLHEALYEGKESYDLQPLHYELVTLTLGSDRSGRGAPCVYTFNFDDVLERAFLEVTGERPQARSPAQSDDPSTIMHFHGYLPLHDDPSPPSRNKIVLSEMDFLQTANDDPDRKILDLLNDPDKDALFIGMSLSDPRLRRLLFRLNQDANDTGKMWAFFSKIHAAPEDPLPVRRARITAAQHTASYWQHWGITALETENYAVLPAALRSIRLGNEVGQWSRKGVEFLQFQEDENGNPKSCYYDLYDELRQAEAYVYLMRQADVIRHRFECSAHEQLSFTLFVPMEDNPKMLAPAFRFCEPATDHRTNAGNWVAVDLPPMLSPASRYVFQELRNYESGEGGEAPEARIENRVRVRTLSLDQAQQRTLEVKTIDSAQGATGLAVATGNVIETSDEQTLFRNFEPEKRNAWREWSTYSALMSVPIYDSKDWVPVGAISIASTLREPFWKRIESSEKEALIQNLRSTFRNLIAYKSHY